MEYITLNKDNLAQEHICCAISEKKGECCVASKKEWLQERLSDGLVFRKGNVRGKLFIEYLPAEKAWCPVQADGYLFINCLWASGQFQGQGYGVELLQSCIDDAKVQAKKGLVIVSSSKKRPYMADAKFLKLYGFQLADTAAPYFELWYLPLQEDAAVPCFLDHAKKGEIEEGGLVLYYTAQCPHTAKYAPLLKQMADSHGVTAKLIRLTTTEEAQNAPTPFPMYTLFKDGRFVTHEILSEKKIVKLLEDGQ